MQRLVRFIKVYPQYTIASVMDMPWHQYITLCRISRGAELFPEVFRRGAEEAAVTEVERLLAQTARARAEGRGIKPPPEETA